MNWTSKYLCLKVYITQFFHDKNKSSPTHPYPLSWHILLSTIKNQNNAFSVGTTWSTMSACRIKMSVNIFGIHLYDPLDKVELADVKNESRGRLNFAKSLWR